MDKQSFWENMNQHLTLLGVDEERLDSFSEKWGERLVQYFGVESFPAIVRSTIQVLAIIDGFLKLRDLTPPIQLPEKCPKQPNVNRKMVPCPGSSRLAVSTPKNIRLCAARKAQCNKRSIGTRKYKDIEWDEKNPIFGKMTNVRRGTNTYARTRNN